jgi:hypothetical protein
MEEQGCFKGDSTAKPFIEFGEKHVGKTVEERLKLFDELNASYKVPCSLNEDGTLSIYFCIIEGDKTKCICRQKPKDVAMKDVSLTFCACCGGHLRFTYQLALGVRLRLIEVVSSALNSGGEKRCEFLFEISES